MVVTRVIVGTTTVVFCKSCERTVDCSFETTKVEELDSTFSGPTVWAVLALLLVAGVVATGTGVTVTTVVLCKSCEPTVDCSFVTTEQ